MKVWLVRAGRYGEREELALEQGLAVVGWDEVGDLSGATTREAVKKLLEAAHPAASPGKIANHAGQLFTFAHQVAKGDCVVLPRKRGGVVALGVVEGPYRYRTDLGDARHVRQVRWVRPDVPRTEFRQDLRYSLGAFMTVCRIQRNDAERRIGQMLGGGADPGPAPGSVERSGGGDGDGGAGVDEEIDVEQIARDQLLAHIESRFKGHGLARLVEAVLVAEGYKTKLSMPGPDGGVDIMAGRGALGFESPRLCVQVKSSSGPCDVSVFRGLLGVIQTFKAEQCLLVSWGGFTSAVEKEARQAYFQVRVWTADDLVEALLRNYAKLPEELQAELPLKRIWALVPEE